MYAVHSRRTIMSMTKRITTNTQLNQWLADFLVEQLSAQSRPVSSSQLSVWASKAAWKLVQQEVLDIAMLDTSASYRAPVREISTSRINRILASTPGVVDAGLRFEYGQGGRKLRHWTTERSNADRLAIEAERQAKVAAIRETVRVRERYDRFEVILDDKLPAAASFVFRRITAIYNGEEIIEEVIAFEGARKFAEDTARQIRRQRLDAAGLLS